MKEETWEFMSVKKLNAQLRKFLANKSVFVVSPMELGLVNFRGEAVGAIIDPKLPGGSIPRDHPVEWVVTPGAFLPTMVFVDVELRGLRGGRKKPRTFRRVYVLLPSLFGFAAKVFAQRKLGFSDGKGAVVTILPESGVLSEITNSLRILTALFAREYEVFAAFEDNALRNLERAFPRAPWLADYRRRARKFAERAEEWSRDYVVSETMDWLIDLARRRERKSEEVGDLGYHG